MFTNSLQGKFGTVTDDATKSVSVSNFAVFSNERTEQLSFNTSEETKSKYFDNNLIINKGILL